MSESIKLLIMEDNPMIAKSIAEHLSAKREIEVVGIANDAKEALEMVNLTEPDALIMDLIVPGQDGFSLLEQLFGGEYAKMPETIVLSAMGQENTVVRAMNLGAKYFMLKPFDMDLLYKRVLDLFDMRNVRTAQSLPAVKSRSLDEQITSVFLTIGIPAHIKGYQFLREAIKLAVKNPEIINSITKELYPGISVIFGTTPSKVERAIRHAIEVAWQRGKIENINTLFGYNIYTKADRPTNGEFIALIADRLLIRDIA